MMKAIEKTKVSIGIRFFYSLVIGLCMNLTVHAQDQLLVEYKLDYPREIHVGDSLKISATLSIKEDFYIYAPTETNSSQGMQITQLRFVQQQLPAGIKRAGGLQFPEPHPKGSYQVFTGEGIKLVQTFIASKDMQPGEVTIKGKLISQACNDHLCYPPVTEPFEAVITVIR